MKTHLSVSLHMALAFTLGGAACSGSKSTGGAGGAVGTGGATAALGGTTATGPTASGGTGSGGTVATNASGGRAGGGTTGGAGRPGTGGGTTDASSIGDAGPAVASKGCSGPLPAACNNTTAGSCKLDVSGKTREYFVVLPTGYDNSKPAPVVFAFHGLGGTASQLLPTGSPYGGGYALYGVQPGLPNAVFVVPQGLDTGSDAGNQYGWPNSGGQDIAFVKAMLAWLEANLCVDSARYFSTGMSYGGMMSETIACQMPDVFRAIGSQAGSLWGGTRNCVAKPIAAWITHGDADTTVPISGDIGARDMIIANNGCDTTNTSTIDLVDTARIGDAATTNVTCTAYGQCSKGNYPVIWCPVPGEGHAIPSFAGAEIAKFFKQF
jgi:poly(3-hydroxybutyrate) depolymerase